jgi:large subunit ribosomal protein L13
MMNRTYNAKPGEVERKWFIVDLDGQTAGRVASKIATLLRGKHKPQFTPHVDTGDFVIAINAEKIKFSGSKWQNKKYYNHSQYLGGLRTFTAKEMLERNPERIIKDAVRGMLPKTKLGNKIFKKFKVYVDDQHKHTAQQPEKIDLSEIK